jgi:hypothetical protein
MQEVSMDDLIRFYNDNHVWILATMWFILTAVFNIATRFKTPEKWVEFGEKNPRGQNFIRLIRALGLDPVKAIKAFGAFLSGKAKETAGDRPVLKDKELP